MSDDDFDPVDDDDFGELADVNVPLEDNQDLADDVLAEFDEEDFDEDFDDDFEEEVDGEYEFREEFGHLEVKDDEEDDLDIIDDV
jgi:DNA-directed RNA polymerase subunit delta